MNHDFNSEVGQLLRLSREFFLISAFRLTDGSQIGTRTKEKFRIWLVEFFKLDAERHALFCDGKDEIVSAVCGIIKTFHQTKQSEVSKRQQLIHQRFVDNFKSATNKNLVGANFLSYLLDGKNLCELIEVEFDSVNWRKFFRSVFSISSYNLIFGQDVDEVISPDDLLRPSVFVESADKSPERGQRKRKEGKTKRKNAQSHTNDQSVILPLEPISAQQEIRVEYDMSSQLSPEGKSRLSLLRKAWETRTGKRGQIPGDNFLVDSWVTSLNSSIQPPEVLSWLETGSNQKIDELVKD